VPKYIYKAIDENGDRVKGTLTAGDMVAATDRLRSCGLTVTEFDEARGTATPGFGDGITSTFGVVRTKDVVLFFRMFSALIASTVTISEAAGILHEQADNRKMRRALGDIRQKIDGGDPLSAAMANYPRIFPHTVTSMIRAGELGGILDTVLERISDYLESRAAVRSRIIISMIYPSVVVVAAVVVITFLVGFVIPKFSLLLGGGKLPANTQFLLDTSDFLTIHARAIIFSFVGIVGLLIVLHSVQPSRLFMDRYKIRIPVIGPILRYAVIVQFSKTLASLLESGITLVDALEATGDTLANEAVRLRIQKMNEKVLSGEPLSDALEGDRFFTPMLKAMVKIGEHSGLMDDAMATVGNLHEKILQDKIARMSAMVEPVLIIVLGGLVGYVAWGLVAGMLAMYTAAS
jgi:type IV pilus assembly protein PilC